MLHTRSRSGSHYQQDLIIITRISGSLEISIRLHIVPFRNPCALRFEIKRAQTSPLSSSSERVPLTTFVTMLALDREAEKIWLIVGENSKTARDLFLIRSKTRREKG